MNQYELILKCLDIICASRIWQDKTPSHTLKLLMYMHNKGFLYTPMTDGKIQAVIGAYRIPEINDNNLNTLPIKEEGNILYVPFVVSINKENNIYKVVRNAVRWYLDKNNDIVEIVLEGKDDKLKRYKIGAINGKKSKPESTSYADISN